MLAQGGFEQGFPAFSGGSPIVLPPGMTVAGFFGTASFWIPIGPMNLWQIIGNATKIHGRHEIKFGVSVHHFKGFDTGVFPSMTFTPTPTADPQNPGTGSSLASFLLGLPSSAFRYLGDASVLQRTNIWGTFLQDSFKVTPKFTLNFGIRWDFTEPVKEEFNRYGSFDPHTRKWVLAQGHLLKPNPLPPNVVELDQPYIAEPVWRNFSPRLGLAYQLTPKTVIRSGFGLFFDNWAGVFQGAQEVRGNWPTGAAQVPVGLNTTFVNATAQNPFGNLPATIPATPFPSGGWAVDRFPKNPYGIQWNLEIQRQLADTLTVSAAYVGSRGNRLITGGTFNTAVVPGPTPIAARQPFPEMFPFSFERGQGRSHYESFQLKVDKRFNRGFTFLASYTNSKLIDIGCSGWAFEGCAIQNVYRLDLERSISQIDVPQVFTVSYLWELPFGKGKPFLKEGWGSGILGNWQVNGITSFRSGIPYNVFLGFDNANVGGGVQRPNLVGDPKLDNPTPERWFNTQAFVIPPRFTFGNTSRNALRADAWQNWDFSLFRSFDIRERHRLQFRAELFNVFNQVNFDPPSGLVISPFFGRVLSAAPSRDIQFALKYIF